MWTVHRFSTTMKWNESVCTNNADFLWLKQIFITLENKKFNIWIYITKMHLVVAYLNIEKNNVFFVFSLQGKAYKYWDIKQRKIIKQNKTKN